MLKHNKKTNAGIVFEQLIATATRLVALKQFKEAKFVTDLIKKHFHPSTNLGKERKLMESFSSLCKTKEEATEVFDEILKQAATINESKLAKEKQSLITAVNKYLSSDLFNIKVENYKNLASAQILFNEARNNLKFTTPQERVKIKNTLVESMIAKEARAEEDLVLDNFTVNLAVEKFNKKYTKMLNEDQQDIVRAYLDYSVTNNPEILRSVLKDKLSKVSGELVLHKESDAHDEDEKAMLTEVSEKINNFDFGDISEDSIYEAMMYFDLVEDLQKIEEEQLK